MGITDRGLNLRSLFIYSFSIICSGQRWRKDEKKEFLQGERKKLTLNKNVKIWVYLYESKEKMEEDAACIQPGGYGYDNGRNAVDVEWVLPPHFFKAENMIVLYVGENLDLINALREIVSEPFAESTE